MKKTSFRQIDATKKRAILASVIAKRTDGKLSKEQIKEIVEAANVSNQLTINVTSDAEKFAKALVLSNWSYSWSSGYEGEKTEAKNLLGSDLNFGTGEIDNGNYEVVEESDFNVEHTHAVEIKSCSYENSSRNNHSHEHFELVIYIPTETATQLEPEIQALVDAFKLN